MLAEELTPLAAGDELLESLLRFRNPGEKFYIHDMYTQQKTKYEDTQNSERISKRSRN